ncbi:MAG: hypothetical protein EA398_11815 [Deltaproteobacteria bacterium]|nr:MAG: hypothetical protein EA398_11815 [Deltaproteobacteria bacterium]
MHPLDELKSYLGFSARDEDTLRTVWPRVAPHLDEICARFYEQALAHPSTRFVIRDDAQLARLMATLKTWMKELFNGPWDEEYFERRQRIGRVHVEIGLPHTAMFMAMGVVREHFLELAHTADLPTEDVCGAIIRITDIDLAAMTGNFLTVHEEERLREFSELIVSSIPVTVVVLDRELRITAATHPERAMLGDRLIPGNPYLDSLPIDLVEGAALEAHIQRAVDTGRQITIPRVDAEIDGLPRHLALHLQPVRHGRASLILHIEDITEAVQNEARLRRSESLAQIGALSAAVAHELRNPLAGISGALQVFAGSLPEDDRRQPIMRKVLDQILGLNRLVSDLLAFARPKEPHVRTVDLRAMAEDVFESQSTEADRVTFEIDGHGSALADPDMLRQVMLNLVLNAIQAMDGEGTVRAECSPGCLRVSDSGPGVAEEAVARLFEPFFTTKVRGTGLGLPISQRMMHAMDGDLELDPRPGLGGACFVIRMDPGAVDRDPT